MQIGNPTKAVLLYKTYKTFRPKNKHMKILTGKTKKTKFFSIPADKFLEVIIVIINGTGFHTDHVTDIYKSSTAKTGSSFSKSLKNEMDAAGRTDTIEISNSGKSAGSNYSALRGIKTKIESDMLCGTDKVKLKNIKAKIENGSYNIDPSEIAGCLLDD